MYVQNAGLIQKHYKIAKIIYIWNINKHGIEYLFNTVYNIALYIKCKEIICKF